MSNLITVSTSYKLKILVLGDKGTGKSTLCLNHASGFSKRYDRSIGVDIFVREVIRRDDGNLNTLACWKFAPESRFHYYFSKFFRGASSAVVMFDLTNRSSFEGVEVWISKIRENLGDIPIILVGNKADDKELRVIDRKNAESLAKEHSLTNYVEISAENGYNVKELFEIINETSFKFRQEANSLIN